MNLFLNDITNCECDDDYPLLKEKYNRLLAENNRLTLVLKDTQIQLNEEKNKIYFEDVHEDPEEKFEKYKRKYDKAMNEKLKNMELQFLKKIESIEGDLYSKTETSFSSSSLENSDIQKVVEEKVNLGNLNKQLQETIDHMAIEVARLEKDNNKLQDTKKLLAEQSRCQQELNEKLKKYEVTIDEYQQKVQSYKFLITDKDRYISTLLDENKNLANQVNDKRDNSPSENHWLQFLQLEHCIAETFDCNEHINRLTLSLKFDTNALNFMKMTHERLRLWIDKLNSGLLQVMTNIDIKINATKVSSNPEKTLIQMNEYLKLLNTHFVNNKDTELKKKEICTTFDMSKRKIPPSTMIFDQRNILIRNLINEIERIKLHYKIQISHMKQLWVDEKERRLTLCAENHKSTRELEHRILDLESKNRFLHEKCVNYQNENEHLNKQLKFLLKQKILLSQQLEEYEYHVMKNFNNKLFSDEPNFIG